MAMDEDTRQAFASIASALQRLDANQSAGNALQIETAREFRSGLVALNGRVDGLVLDVNGLKKHVFGSEPPPDTPSTALVRQVSEQDMEHDALKAHVIVLDSKVDALTQMQEEQTKTLMEIKNAVTSVVKHPMVRRIAWAIGTGLLAWLSTKGWLHS